MLGGWLWHVRWLTWHVRWLIGWMADNHIYGYNFLSFDHTEMSLVSFYSSGQAGHFGVGYKFVQPLEGCFVFFYNKLGSQFWPASLWSGSQFWLIYIARWTDIIVLIKTAYGRCLYEPMVSKQELLEVDPSHHWWYNLLLVLMHFSSFHQALSSLWLLGLVVGDALSAWLVIIFTLGGWYTQSWSELNQVQCQWCSTWEQCAAWFICYIECHLQLVS